ncbi:MAG: rhodanese-related sulfurtransferase [Candidatus Paceibacterota bacterium]
MSDWQILLFYKYVYIQDPVAVRDWFFELCTTYNLKGRLIIATEGINFTFEGKKQDTEDFIIEMQKDERYGSLFQNIHFKRSVGDGTSFPKLSVKVRDEIVTGNLGVCDINPNEVTGKHLSPKELHDWIMENKAASAQGYGAPREFYIIDMRNAYEHKVGKFAGSITPELNNFRDLPNIIQSIAHLKDKTVVTVCTGGVRCEKASGYLITQGFNDVYQLDGGIVSYMEQFPNEDFEGKLYVFDQRVMMGFYTDDPKHKVIAKCDYCATTTEQYLNCQNKKCNKHILMCDDCQSKSIAKHGKKVCLDGCLPRRSSNGGWVSSTIWSKIRKLWKN